MARHRQKSDEVIELIEVFLYRHTIALGCGTWFLKWRRYAYRCRTLDTCEMGASWTTVTTRHSRQSTAGITATLELGEAQAADCRKRPSQSTAGACLVCGDFVREDIYRPHRVLDEDGRRDGVISPDQN